ncbi:MAG: FprA family A-type flavoprotein [Candidatus Thorarchaeota archaeon]|nr:MAG: FprA family A-type flavoprotein [Candidatus Thorarchaeota archaeon]
MKVMIIYESTRGRTKAMAEAIREGATLAGGECAVVDAQDFSSLEGVCALAVGSSTRMTRVLPIVKRILSELPKLNGLPTAAFGSYGWSGEAPDEISAKLKELGGTLVSEQPIKAKDYPAESILAECRSLGEKLAASCS